MRSVGCILISDGIGDHGEKTTPLTKPQPTALRGCELGLSLHHNSRTHFTASLTVPSSEISVEEEASELSSDCSLEERVI